MNRLAQELARIIREKVQVATSGTTTDQLEVRFIFHGPPVEILERVFEELTKKDGLNIDLRPEVKDFLLPVLLVLPAARRTGYNPDIGISGECDESHLLHIRNDPNSASFVALLPPGQHSNRSVASTTEEFGMSASSNSGHATFEEWWGDEFIRGLVERAIRGVGIEEKGSRDDAKIIIEQAAIAADEVDDSLGQRSAHWRLLARIYSIQEDARGLPAGSALALACGFPPMPDGTLSAKSQVGILGKIADEMADGFKAGLDRLASQGTVGLKTDALSSLLTHLQYTCEIATTFERAAPAFYVPSAGHVIETPPPWWITLSSDRWIELLSEEPDVASGELSISCSNAVLPASRGIPAVVFSDVELAISAAEDTGDTPFQVLLTGGSYGRDGISINVEGPTSFHDGPSTSSRSAPFTYKVVADNRKAANVKVISLESWVAGIVVTSRLATKLSPPKRPRRGNTGADWESSMSFPGPGRYELLLLVLPDTKINAVHGLVDDSTEQLDDALEELAFHNVRQGQYHVEVEADGQYQMDVSYTQVGSKSDEICRLFITCEDVKEEGCRSEFERLIKLHRRNVERFDARTVVQLDRHARLSSLQGWILATESVRKSFVPLVFSDDYAAMWAAPDWDIDVGPIFSKARFLHDPRPKSELFVPPKGFVEAREIIAKRIRDTSDQAGLVESASLGKWLSRDPDFREQVEIYLSAYMEWFASDRDVASWVDTIAVCSRESDGRTLARVPDAILVSPLHPLRLAWHCLAQRVLHEELESDEPRPCPAASILDPDCIPDIMEMPLQAPRGQSGINRVAFLAVECNSDYWSVLWNGDRLAQIAEKSRKAPFDDALGLVVGGISSGFSPAQVARALGDVTDLLAAKPVVSLVVSSGGGATDACNEGLANWCAKRFGNGEGSEHRGGVGPRVLEVFDTRPVNSRPDHAMVANLSEDTDNRVRWFERQPESAKPDLGIIAQLDSAEPEAATVDMLSPLGTGGLVRHRVRRQLKGAFICESRQAAPTLSSDDVFADKVASCICMLENGRDGALGLQFAPNVYAVSDMLQNKKAGFVAVSSSVVDPACFLGGWIPGTYLWDYDLPSYSHRAGDTSGYYLLSKVRDTDRDAIERVLSPLPGCEELDEFHIKGTLLEVARRGIPTIRGLSGDDTGATGDLGLFLAVRLLQDQFRTSQNRDSLLPVLSGTSDDATIALIVPVDPFRGYLADLTRSLGKERKDASLSRPDLLVIGAHLCDGKVRIHLTPIEVKCRNKSITLTSSEAKDALAQASALSVLLGKLKDRAAGSVVWKLAYQHLLLSMIGFGLRVYSQHEIVSKEGARWAGYHERIAEAILGPIDSISVDDTGRLIVIDGTVSSDAHDHDGDGFKESITISPKDAGSIAGGDPQSFYDAVRSKVRDWRLLPLRTEASDAPFAESKLAQVYTPDKIDDANEIPSNELATKTIESSIASASVVPAPSAPSSASTAMATCGVVLSVGKSVDGFEPRPITLNISDTKLNQLNIGVVGDLGTGKTQLLKSLIFQIASSTEANRGVKPRFLIFDYKRDYSSSEFVEATGARVVKPVGLPLNLFDTTTIGDSNSPWLDRFRFFADILDKVYSGIGPVQRDKLKGAVRSAYDVCGAAGRQPSIYDVHAEYKRLLEGKSDAPMAIIDDLVDMGIFERDPSKTKTFDEFLDGIVVISLDAMGQDDRSKNMLVAIMLNMFYENMLRTPKRPYEGSNPQLRVIDSYLLVDEADNIMRYEFDVLRKLLLQGREFGAGVILASQYLRHFKVNATDYKDPLLTWWIHKVPNVTPTELAALGLPSNLGEVSERVKTLANHQCLYKTSDSPGEVIRGLPFFELV